MPAVANYLANHPLRHGELAVLTREIGVSARTLFSWRHRGGRVGRCGRPPRPQEERVQARALIEPRWKALARGHQGWRTARAALERDKLVVPTRLVQETLRGLRRERAQREREQRKKSRVHVEVLVRDGVWALDQFFIGRDAHGAMTALECGDRCTRRTLSLSLGPPACGKDVVALLEQAAHEHGGVWPFVVQVDNGSENINAKVAACLREHQVILLRNLPHTPQHNAFAEHNNGDLQRASGLDKASRRRAKALECPVCLADPGVLATGASCAAKLTLAWHALDVCTPRASLGNLTPCELDRIAPRAEDRACRAHFYTQVCQELECIARSGASKRDLRKQEREAIWCALERHGLVQRTRGGLPVRALKSEVIS